MEIQFSSPVNSHYFALRCIPGDSSRQRIALTEQNIYPADYLARTKDGFGNIRLSGCCQGPHETFGYTIAGTALTRGMEAEKLCRKLGKEQNLEKAYARIMLIL